MLSHSKPEICDDICDEYSAFMVDGIPDSIVICLIQTIFTYKLVTTVYYVWVWTYTFSSFLCKCSGYMQIRSTGYSDLPIGVSVYGSLLALG